MFTMRSNVFYNGSIDPDPPLYGHPITIEENDFVQIVQIVSNDWWIGRLIGGPPVYVLCDRHPEFPLFKKRGVEGNICKKRKINLRVAVKHTVVGVTQLAIVKIFRFMWKLFSCNPQKGYDSDTVSDFQGKISKK